jgi:hypothetical protein
VKAFLLSTGHQTSPDALPKEVRESLGRVTFNNNYQDYSQLNARRLMEMLL